ncbi:MAG: ABC transporter ATP-binding protein/permease [Candidatus Saccharibacteria bacterium]|nr:ABC transporter ATP-binding protein/permease [Candidatus Saccharibacteria bacterium]
MFNGGPGGRRGGQNEKVKNFSKAIKRMVFEMKPFYALIAIAMVMSVAGSILSVIAPDKLADITDEISAGLILDREKVSSVATELMQDPLSASEIDGTTISPEDKIAFAEKMQELQSEMEGVTEFKEEDASKIYKKIDELPESVQEVIKPKMNFEAIKSAAIFMICLYLSSAILEFLEGFIMARVTTGFARDLRNRISYKINKLPLKYFDRNQIGDTLSRVTNDVDAVSSSMDNSFATIIGEGSLLLGSLVMMLVTNWTMALVAVITSLFGFSFMSIILKRSQKYFTMRQVELGNMNAHIEEVYSGITVVKAYDGKQTADKRFDKLNAKIRTANMNGQFLSGMMHPIMAFTGHLGYVAVCVTGALLAMNGVISFGVIVAFMVYVRLFSSPLSRIAQAVGGLQPAAAASERVFEFIDEEEMSDESQIEAHINKDTIKGDIVFDHIKFGYDDNKTIIKDFSAEAKAGQKIAIVGPTGAGKTTMVNLLMKFYEVKEGDIRIDGVSTKEMTRADVHSLFTMVLQDTWMFSGTVRENIAYNHKNVSDEDIMKICDTVGLTHFIKTLPKGLKTDITDSESVSAGQKQLITIARGMVEDAPFLILDEATSNVDTRTEELVQKAMDKLMEGRTSFIIAHRLSTIKNADLILVMNEGNIVETGNHKQLMEKGGFYADLYNSQFAL